MLSAVSYGILSLLFVELLQVRLIDSFSPPQACVFGKSGITTNTAWSHPTISLAQVVPSSTHNAGVGKTAGTTALHMGILDRVSSFFDGRKDDFVPITSMSETYGPPVILLYGLPSGISNDEVQDMVSDGAPLAYSQGIAVHLVDDSDQDFLDQPVLKALEDVWEDYQRQQQQQSSVNKKRINIPLPTSSYRNNNKKNDVMTIPVVYCSGLSNGEMMDTYNIIAKEIYAETEGKAQAACAKAVKPAMEKSLRQVFGEITGDHMDAINVWT